MDRWCENSYDETLLADLCFSYLGKTYEEFQIIMKENIMKLKHLFSNE